MANKTEKKAVTIGGDLNFAAREAYKLLRSNLLFSFADDKDCHVIAFSSSIKGEGKTTTAINTAFALAESGLRVLIIDGDMRLPQVHKLLKLNQTPGLSNLLAGQVSGDTIIQQSKLNANLFTITSGAIPPNPTELLSSKRMNQVIALLSKKFDYIILDLPPVGIVSDALLTSGYIDGMVLVVRCNYSDKRAISDTVNQLRFHKINILGIVLNDAEISGKFYRKGYYKGGYYKNGSDYSYYGEEDNK